MELEQLERIERHVRSLETAYERERQQRDHLEKKYARLKRRFIRLERSHAKLLLETQAVGCQAQYSCGAAANRSAMSHLWVDRIERKQRARSVHAAIA